MCEAKEREREREGLSRLGPTKVHSIGPTAMTLATTPMDALTDELISSATKLIRSDT